MSDPARRFRGQEGTPTPREQGTGQRRSCASRTGCPCHVRTRRQESTWRKLYASNKKSVFWVLLITEKYLKVQLGYILRASRNQNKHKMSPKSVLFKTSRFLDKVRISWFVLSWPDNFKWLSLRTVKLALFFSRLIPQKCLQSNKANHKATIMSIPCCVYAGRN